MKQLHTLINSVIYKIPNITVWGFILFFSFSLKAVENRKLHAHSVGLGLGQTVLFNNFSDTGKNKITLDAFYSYSASYTFDLIADLHYSKHSKDNLSTTLLGSAFSIKGRMYDFDSFSPFILGGVGFYMPTQKRMIQNQVIDSTQKLVFGLNIGSGVDLFLNESFSVGLLAQYHHPLSVSQINGSSVNGSYLKFLLTLFYTF